MSSPIKIGLAFVAGAILGSMVTAFHFERSRPDPAVTANSTLASLSTATIQAGPAEAPAPEKWKIDKSENELDNAKKIALNDGELFLRCAPRFEAYIIPPLPNLGHSLDSDGEHQQRIRFRIDGGPLQSESWNISADFEAVFIPAVTLRKVIAAQKLVFEYKPSYVTPMTMTLDLTGLDQAYKKAGCPALKVQRDRPGTDAGDEDSVK
jgi:hypothetical protein